MEFWNGQLELAQRRVAEIEERLWLQQQEVQHLHARGDDPGLHLRLHLRLVVMEQSLARAKAHALYVERRTWVRKGEADWCRRQSAAQQPPIGGPSARA